MPASVSARYEKQDLTSRAHRLSPVQSTDRTMVIDQGRNQAIGSHAELMANSPLYARLAELWFWNG